MYVHFKRFLDVLLSSFLLIILFPLLVLVALLIRLSMGKPVFFKQIRIGKDNLPFSIIKFRTMAMKTVESNTDVLRITKLGRFLRVTRIDELPQLINICGGEMSFIGPRPLLPDYMPYYNHNELHRHDVRPGLSGLSQVSGSYMDWEEQFKLDVEYVDKLSLRLDMVIIGKTICKVLKPSKKLKTGNSGRQRFDHYRRITNSLIRN